jgi:murein DD-endopeptidase MepM/ murein hydrolase activator NlpD
MIYRMQPALKPFPGIFVLGVLFIPLLLAACGHTVEPASVSLLTEKPIQPFILATLQPRTPIPPPTRRVVVVTEVSVVTPIPSLTPLPPPFVYIFPIQPPGACSYAQGVKGHGYPATDLFANPGTKFVAVTNGIVDFVSISDEWDPLNPDPAKRSGMAIAIIGEDHLRYYGSHLSDIAPGIVPGVKVKAGQLLGFVGASGDAVGKDPHLHFGISHPSTPEDWKARRGELDPYPYLLAWEQGVNLSPHFP